MVGMDVLFTGKTWTLTLNCLTVDHELVEAITSEHIVSRCERTRSLMEKSLNQLLSMVLVIEELERIHAKDYPSEDVEAFEDIEQDNDGRMKMM